MSFTEFENQFLLPFAVKSAQLFTSYSNKYLTEVIVCFDVCSSVHHRMTVDDAQIVEIHEARRVCQVLIRNWPFCCILVWLYRMSFIDCKELFSDVIYEYK